MTLGLMGLRGQGMNGRRGTLKPVVYVYPSGTFNFVAPKSGKYVIAARGAGGGGGSGGANVGGSSGALVIGERVLIKGQIVALSVAASPGFNADGSATTVTFSASDIMTAGGGGEGFTPDPVGAASSTNAFDTLLNGSLATVAGLGNAGGTSGAGLGGGAPGKDGFIGGSATNTLAVGPGVGGKATNGNGGPGEVIIHQTRMRP